MAFIIHILNSKARLSMLFRISQGAHERNILRPAAFRLINE